MVEIIISDRILTKKKIQKKIIKIARKLTKEMEKKIDLHHKELKGFGISLN